MDIEQKALELQNKIAISNLERISEQIAKIIEDNHLKLEGYVELSKDSILAMANAIMKNPFLSSFKVKAEFFNLTEK